MESNARTFTVQERYDTVKMGLPAFGPSLGLRHCSMKPCSRFNSQKRAISVHLWNDAMPWTGHPAPAPVTMGVTAWRCFVKRGITRMSMVTLNGAARQLVAALCDNLSR